MSEVTDDVLRWSIATLALIGAAGCLVAYVQIGRLCSPVALR